MELIRGLHNFSPRHYGCVATIGNFDGIHRGHQALISQLTQMALQLKLPSVVITFEPHPQEHFSPEKAWPRLTLVREKFEVLQRYEVDRLCCLYFNKALATLSANDFIRKILVESLGVRYLIVGDDFHFGHDREGDFAMLQTAGREYGFQVVSTPTLTHKGDRVSSRRVREALAHDDLMLAKELLGRPYTLSGRIIHGDKRGRSIGFPTANILLRRPTSPILGVYAVKMHSLSLGMLYGVANIGNRPTVGGSRCLLEVHLFDFDAEIYGMQVEVEFCHKLRNEQRYPSFELLKEQIFKDAANARQFFHDNP